MRNKDIDQVEYYILKEKQFNETLISTFNCNEFTSLSATILNTNLDFLFEMRKSITQWLDVISVPTKNDVAHFTNHIIKLEAKTDSLEENVYNLLKMSESHQQLLNNLYYDMQGLQVLVQSGLEPDKNEANLDLLKQELKELMAGL